jgi:hypothetical protein
MELKVVEMVHRRPPLLGKLRLLHCLRNPPVVHSKTSVAMNFQDPPSQGAIPASEHGHASLITPSTSTATACNDCADRDHDGVLPRFHPSDATGDQPDGGPDDGSNLSHCLCGERSCAEQRKTSSRSDVTGTLKKNSWTPPDIVMQLLAAQNGFLAEKLTEARTKLESTQNHDNASEMLDRPGSVADNEDGDDDPLQMMKLAMKKRQQVEESLQEECRQLREGLSHMLSLVGLTMAHFDPKDMSAILLPGLDPLPDGFPLPDMGAQLDMNVFDGPFAYDKIKKRGITQVQMKDVREGLRLVTKICTILCLIIGIVALLRLPGQLSGPLRLMDQKQRGMGVWVRW